MTMTTKVLIGFGLLGALGFYSQSLRENENALAMEAAFAEAAAEREAERKKFDSLDAEARDALNVGPRANATITLDDGRRGRLRNFREAPDWAEGHRSKATLAVGDESYKVIVYYDPDWNVVSVRLGPAGKYLKR